MTTSTQKKTTVIARNSKSNVRAAVKLDNERKIAKLALPVTSLRSAQGRGGLLKALHLILGTSPTNAQLLEVKALWATGEIAFDLLGLTPQQRPKRIGDVKGMGAGEAEALRFADVIVNRLAMPETKNLGAKIGLRTKEQQLWIGAIDQRWSKLKAELGFGKAKTQAETDKKKKRKARGAVDQNPPKVTTPPAPPEEPKVRTAEECNAFVLTQFQSVAHFCKGNGDKVYSDVQNIVNNATALIAKALKEHAEAKRAAAQKAEEAKAIVAAAKAQKAGTLGAAVTSKRTKGRRK